jgi:polyhydroxyalkanoate synthesis regulator phasin
MNDLWLKARYGCLGFLDLTGEEVAALVQEMVKRGEIAQQEASQAEADLLAMAQAQQEALMNKLAAMMEKIIAGAGLARAADLEALKNRVSQLEAGPAGGPG